MSVHPLRSVVDLERVGSREIDDLVAHSGPTRRLKLRGGPVLALPEHVRETAIAALAEPDRRPARGLPELREAIAERFFADAGTKNVTAYFVPTDSTKVAASNSDVSVITVTGAATAPASAVTLAVPSIATVGETVSLSAKVAATGLAAGVTTTGTIQFKDGDTVLTMTPATITVSGLTNSTDGVTVTATTSFATAGAKSITAWFVPADATVVAASTSGAGTITVSAAVVPPTSVRAGTGGQAQPGTVLWLAEALLAGAGVTVVGAGWFLSRRRTGIDKHLARDRRTGVDSRTGVAV